ncbi:MAG: glutaredoxin domain-containing protein [Actinomycetota bacterium]
MTDSDPGPARVPGADDEPVTVYWRPGCQFCMALRVGMWLARIPSHRVNIWRDPDAAARVRAVAGGNETVPTVFVGDTALVNPSVRDIKRAMADAAGS